MSQILISNLTFSHEGNGHEIFKDVNLSLDSNWRLGLVGRNGRGKTTFLKILSGAFGEEKSIASDVIFEYFPYEIPDKDETVMEVIKNAVAPFSKWESQMEQCLQSGSEADILRYGDILSAYEDFGGYEIEERVKAEMGRLEVDSSALLRPFSSLSGGEQVKASLGALFLRKNHFLLIDEPTNHLDFESREVVSRYLSSKKGFILVSHDREFLDRSVDHILSINRGNIELARGNFTSFEENFEKRNESELLKNERLKREILGLSQAAKRTENWSNIVEKSKIGAADKGYVGHKAAKMMKRSKSILKRQEDMIEEKKGLLKNVETESFVYLEPLKTHHKEIFSFKNFSLLRNGRELFSPLSFDFGPGERVAIRGRNGSGKSSLFAFLRGEELLYNGEAQIKGNLEVSYVPQVIGALPCELSEFIAERGLDETYFKSLLRKLGFEREQFEKNPNAFSAGQKKKLMIAAALSRPSHVYLFDEPLNFMDIFSRKQMEEMFVASGATVMFIEHDMHFIKKVATKIVTVLGNG